MKEKDLSNLFSNSTQGERFDLAWDTLAGDQVLSSLLSRWQIPAVPASLENRLLTAFRNRTSLFAVQEISVEESLPCLPLLATEEVTAMKQCNTCKVEFASKFAFCPIDGTKLTSTLFDREGTAVALDEPRLLFDEQIESTFPSVSRDAYRLTIIEDKGVVRRLLTELNQAAAQSRLTWPEFKRNPIAFARRTLSAYGTMTWRFFSGPNVAVACLTAILLMMTTVVGLVWMDRRHAQQARAAADKLNEDVEFVGIVDIPNMQKPDDGSAGLNQGSGGGSKPDQSRPGGGGGGGREDELVASRGKVPPGALEPPILAPDPKTTPIKNPALPTAVTIQADPLLFPPDLNPVPYGDPKSNSTQASSGQGTGGGIGTGSGVGVGSGDGRGFGPGSDFNTGGGSGKLGGGGPGGPDGGGGLPKVFKPDQVQQKARIISKPIPEYTEEARRNQVTGTVVLQMVFAANGSVTNIRTITGLPFGLTEKAMAAAKRIQFSPAMKDGRAVSQYIRVEYNFNIY